MIKKLGKKGEDMLVDFWAILIFAIICVLFLIIFSVSKSSVNNTMVQEFNDKDVHFMLDSFLRAPVPGEGRTVAEVIIDDASTGDLSEARTLFYSFFRQIKTYEDVNEKDNIVRIHLCVTKDGNEMGGGTIYRDNSVNTDPDCSSTSASQHIIDSTIIPESDGENIKVTLGLYTLVSYK